ncbi:MAG: TlpA family protein disulfide reductase [Saprospiraceae bacterium]|nr:TlpA family protein disulfide reductase [Bacteroidia bacterium]NNE13414.1 TlpA family protein disulfide reductase [Saprospiraceae bacterium]NNL93783.1 TlpA family protein disulfide reductase [Saprospiraceae bacterium]
MKSTIIKAVFALAIGYSGYYFLLRSPSSTKGKLAPDFESQLIDGSKFNLSSLKGNYVLLDFWGSWCPPCRRDNPNLVKLHNQFYNESFKDANNFHIVTVALEKNDKTWKKAADRDGFKWEHQIVEQAKVVLLSPLAQKYAVKDIPAKFLIDPDGNIVGVNQPYSEIKAYLQSKI